MCGCVSPNDRRMSLQIVVETLIEDRLRSFEDTALASKDHSSKGQPRVAD